MMFALLFQRELIDFIRLCLVDCNRSGCPNASKSGIEDTEKRRNI